MSQQQQVWKQLKELPSARVQVLAELKPRAHGDTPALAVVEYHPYPAFPDTGFWALPRSNAPVEITRWRYLVEVEPTSTTVSTERSRNIEHALRQIVDADDNQVLSQQLIEIGRAALDIKKPASTGLAEPEDPYPSKSDEELGFNYRMLLMSHAKGVDVNFITGTMARVGPSVLKSKDEHALNAKRYAKLRRWMSSNVPEGWRVVENLAAVACYVDWNAFDIELDALAECSVGLCSPAVTAQPKAEPQNTGK